jgi:hypothetical protein
MNTWEAFARDKGKFIALIQQSDRAAPPTTEPSLMSRRRDLNELRILPVCSLSPSVYHYHECGKKLWNVIHN